MKHPHRGHLKIVFFGTPAFAAHVLQFLIEQNVQIAAVVTQPDRPQGRKLQLTPPAVKQVAMQLAPEIPVLQPEKASNAIFLEELSAFYADLFVVVAYGQILSQKLLNIPPMGCINIHASLLPKYRGAAPIQRSLMNGDPETGIAIQKMVYQLDAGDVIDEKKIPISPEMTFGELEQQLCEISKSLLLSVLGKYATGTPPAAAPQNHDQVTIAPKIKPEELEVRWEREALFLHNLIRGVSPRPGAWCWIEANGERKRLKILRTKVSIREGTPGELLAFEGDSCIVATGKKSLQLLEVQPEGKKPMPVGQWIRGCQSPPSFSSHTV